MEDVGVAVALLKKFCLDERGDFQTTNFEKAMRLYQDIRIKRSGEVLDFSKALGAMQASRSRSRGDKHVSEVEHMLKGEVLMYGTLPVMMPGADHDYKDDVQAVTEERICKVSAEEAKDAYEAIFGVKEELMLPYKCKVTPEDAYEAWMTLMGGCA